MPCIQCLHGAIKETGGAGAGRGVPLGAEPAWSRAQAWQEPSLPTALPPGYLEHPPGGGGHLKADPRALGCSTSSPAGPQQPPPEILQALERA